jgi:hypothetical protein
MASDQTYAVEIEPATEQTREDEAARMAGAIVERGRAALEGVPAVADSARGLIGEAQSQIDGMSDMGVVAAAGFALGVSFGLLLAGAPRALVVLSAIPAALTMRSAFARGVAPARARH